MRVLIANPPWPGDGYGVRTNSRWPHRRGDKKLPYPIYLAYTLALLKKEQFNVKGIDAVVNEWGISRFVNEAKRFEPNIALIEISAPSLHFDLETCEQLKEALPDCKIVVCGAHSSFAHKKLLENYSFIDICIRGEFEYVFNEVCNVLEKKRGSLGLKTVRGITFRDNTGKIIENDDSHLISNLDELPFPDREEFRIEDYQQAFYSGKKTALLISTRGCPNNCSFCIWPQIMYGHKYRTRSPKNVLDEVEFLIQKYGIDEIAFDDDSFALTSQRIKEVCGEFLKRNLKIPWTCMGRANAVDYETAKLMKKAGCTQIFYGFESGSEKILKQINKGITKEQMVGAVKATQKAGMVASGSFIFGLPEEDKETIKETIKFAKKLKADYVQFTLAEPFPGSQFYKEVESEGLLHINSLADLDGTHGGIVSTRHLSREQLNGILRKAYLSYYTNPSIVWQSLKKVRSAREARRILTGAGSVLSRVFYLRK